MNNLNKKQKIIILILIIIISIASYYYIYAFEDFSQNETENMLEIKQQNQINKTQSEKEEKIFIHIAGCVQKEGILELPSNSRIADSIEQAGGLTEEADLTNINLATILEDGMKIYIPNKNEKQENTTISNEITNTQETLKKVNINKATQSELETLPGIGPSTALKILEYRKENGKFTSKEQLKEVSGIGDAKYKKIKDYINI